MKDVTDKYLVLCPHLFVCLYQTFTLIRSTSIFFIFFIFKSRIFSYKAETIFLHNRFVYHLQISIDRFILQLSTSHYSVSFTLPGRGALSRLGRKPHIHNENRRATYNISNQPESRSESVFTTFDDDMKQLVPVSDSETTLPLLHWSLSFLLKCCSFF